MAQLAEFNIGRLRVALDDAVLEPYLVAVETVIADAEAADGFVWRDQYLAAFDDPNPFGPDALATISVWSSIDALRKFTYSGNHRESFRGRHQWFVAHDSPAMVLWWVDDGHHPDPDEANARLEHLTQHGSTERAFTFASHYPPP